MVLQLVLHAAPQPLGEGVGHDGVAGGHELRRDPIGLVIFEHGLGLVRRRHDEGRHEPGEEHRREPNAERQERQQDEVVRQQAEQLLLRPWTFLLHSLHRDLHGVHPPEREERRERHEEGPVLNLPEGTVVLRIGRPGVQEGVGRDVLVDPLLVGEGVVLVVLVGPPGAPESRGVADEETEAVGPLVDAVDVVVPEPTGVGHGEGGQEDGEGGGGLGR
mmetsp:Transcript_34674/g.70786  ORF Transcript_34674/g.70786 Transcript_34674/m.70786 type:complete len:218 (-) Transcript_34674:304-957(-)